MKTWSSQYHHLKFGNYSQKCFFVYSTKWRHTVTTARSRWPAVGPPKASHRYDIYCWLQHIHNGNVRIWLFVALDNSGFLFIVNLYDLTCLFDKYSTLQRGKDGPSSAFFIWLCILTILCILRKCFSNKIKVILSLFFVNY